MQNNKMTKMNNNIKEYNHRSSGNTNWLGTLL
jgi:hypothetical protein